jgi:plastocyanin
MGIQRRVVIKRNASPPPRGVFDPNRVVAQPNDQIFWFNDDTEGHWPAPLDDDGKILDPKAFMDFQIPPKNPSPTVNFAGNPDDEVQYGCSLHLDPEQRATERGTVKFAGNP